MNTDSHIGEYIKQKLKDQGRQGSWLAEKLGFTRQNIYPSIFEKSVIPVERLIELERILGKEFFDDFYEQNPNVQPSVREVKSEYTTQDVQPNIQPKTHGFSLSLQIDPANFDPEDTPILSKHLQKMLEGYQEEIKQLKK